MSTTPDCVSSCEEMGHSGTHKHSILSCDGVGIYISLPPIPPSNQAVNQAAVRTRMVSLSRSIYVMSRRDVQESYALVL